LPCSASPLPSSHFFSCRKLLRKILITLRGT